MIMRNEFSDSIAVDTSYFRMLCQHSNAVYGKTFWCLHGRIHVRDFGTSLEKRNLGGGTLYEDGVTIEVSTAMGGRVILTGKSQREKTI